MEIVKNTYSDIPEIMQVFAEARRAIARFGIEQWQNGYPDESVVKEDISLGRSYSVRTGGVICGLFSMIEDGEPTYEVITGGEWLSGHDGKYIAVHRVAVSDSMRGRGLSKMIFGYVSEQALKKGFPYIRIDTHEGNLAMRRTLEKNGFFRCGRIFLGNGDPRVAYEKPVI
ncbi:MAG: GNAT family N-acetyltransferase [Clostridia bacterium]|nr:GNAT family N-acetyltransferase [Clostridia bacterium]